MFKASNATTNFREPSEMVPYDHREIVPRKLLVMKFTRVSDAYAVADLGATPVARVSKMWLTAFHIKNPSSLNPVRVEFSEDIEAGLANNMRSTTGQDRS